MSTPSPQPTIGVFLSMGETYPPLIINQLTVAAKAHGQRLAMCGFPSYGSFNGVGIGYALEELGYDPAKFDACLTFFGSPPLLERMTRVYEQGTPCVFVMRESPIVPHLIPNDEPQIAALVARLYRHGHRRIACLSGGLDNPSVRRRIEGYRRGLAAVGLPYDPDLVLFGDLQDELSYDAVDQALRRGVRFTALFGCNDTSTLGGLRALVAHGISVPSECEVVGFDNDHAAAAATPPLSTFQLPLASMAYQAIERLARMLRGEPVPTETRFRPLFIPRDSTRFEDRDDVLDAAPECDDSQATGSEIVPDLSSIPTTAPLSTILTAARTIFARELKRGVDFEAVAEAIRARSMPIRMEPSDDANQDLAAALDLLVDVVRHREVMAAEHDQTFAARTIELRELAFRVPTEDEVVETLRRTLARLGFQSARLYLRQPMMDRQPAGEERVHAWDLAAGTVDVRLASGGELQDAALAFAATHVLAFSMPLIAYDRVLGNLVCDGQCRFGDRLAILTRHFTGILHGLRLRAHLVGVNEHLRRTQRELIEASRNAGIAEMATGVLHNIGNALNGVNTSACLVADGLHALKIDSVGRLAGLLVREEETWSRHFIDEERGRATVQFVSTLESHLQRGRESLQREVQSLREGMNHLAGIVASQQQFARVGGVVDEIVPSELADYALRLCEAELLRHRIAVVRDYLPAPVVRVELHKPVQILVNLIRNAKDALNDSERADKAIRLVVKTTPASDVIFRVEDNGVGIVSEDLPRLFTMGFTTKKSGHGFGLHNSALVASSLGGKLEAESAGPGHGAVFILTLKPDCGSPA